MAIIMSYQVDFKFRCIIRGQSYRYIQLKESIQQEDKTILNSHDPISIFPKYIQLLRGAAKSHCEGHRYRDKQRVVAIFAIYHTDRRKKVTVKKYLSNQLKRKKYFINP